VALIVNNSEMENFVMRDDALCNMFYHQKKWIIILWFIETKLILE